MLSSSAQLTQENPHTAVFTVTEGMFRLEELVFVTRRDLRVGKVLRRREHQPHRTVGRPVAIELHEGSLVWLTVVNDQLGYSVRFPFDLRIDSVEKHTEPVRTELPSEYLAEPCDIEDLRRRHERKFKNKISFV
jgi:hypothetical protein